MFAKRSEKEKSVKLLRKLLKKHNDDLEIVLLAMRKKKASTICLVHALSEVLNISMEEADNIFINSEAFKDLKEETLKLRKMFNDVLAEGADDIVEGEDGKTYCVYDLSKVEDDSGKRAKRFLSFRYRSFYDLPYNIKVAIRDAQIATDLEKYVKCKVPDLNNRSILDIYNKETEEKATELVLWLIGKQINGGAGPPYPAEY
jgi:hypothetical protein